MRSVSRRPKRLFGADNPYALSFADVLAALLLIFIIALAATMISFIETKENLVEIAAGGEQYRAELLRTIQEALANEHIHVEITENNSVLRIPDEEVSFQSNRPDMLLDHSVMVKRLEVIGRQLFEILHANPDRTSKYLDTVFVEGHTDSLPTDFRQGNWGLSAARAIWVWNQWLSDSVAPGLSELTNIDGKPLFSVSGYGSTRRVSESELTHEERTMNRRIDIRFTLRALSKDELERFEEDIETIIEE